MLCQKFSNLTGWHFLRFSIDVFKVKILFLIATIKLFGKKRGRWWLSLHIVGKGKLRFLSISTILKYFRGDASQTNLSNWQGQCLWPLTTDHPRSCCYRTSLDWVHYPYCGYIPAPEISSLFIKKYKL